MDSKNQRILELSKELLKENGYVLIQGKGEEDILPPEALAELDKIGFRVYGFDDMFNSATFKTITYINSAEGLINFLNEDICKRFVTHVKIEELPVTHSTIYTSNPRMCLYLNTTHKRIESFKASFIGRKGLRLTELSKYVGYSISLISKEVN